MGISGHDPTPDKMGFWGKLSNFRQIHAQSQNPGVQSLFIHGQDRPSGEAAAPDSFFPKQQSND